MKFEFRINGLLLPVTPSSYEIDDSRDIQTIESVGLGNVHVIGYKKLKTIVISGIFPCRDYYFASSRLYANPLYYVKVIQAHVDNKDIVRLIIADENITKINAQMIVQSIKWGESQHDNGDITYQITLAEYVKMHAPNVNTAETTIGGNNARP
ncbi:MAG: hypothetical protein BEN18_10265 [Epulopiscium sp. Nuni2H_MBin001]|nr:MAG: hypothetical protein BEN18_10265 [Epulopiscium sp. Nuni2H_MBin001]